MEKSNKNCYDLHKSSYSPKGESHPRLVQTTNILLADEPSKDTPPVQKGNLVFYCSYNTF